MAPTSTAIGFSFLAVGLLFCGIHFFNAFKKIGGPRAGARIGILLSVAFLSNGFAVGILGIGASFFVHRPEILSLLFVVSNIALTLTTASWAYLTFYIFFPSFSPLPGVAAAVVHGISVVVLSIVTHPAPFADTSGGIDWNLSPTLATMLAYMLFINIGAPFLIFSHAYSQAKSREVKTVSLALAILALIGLINNIGRYLPSSVGIRPIQTRFYDTTHIFMGAVFIAVFVLPPFLIKWFTRHKN